MDTDESPQQFRESLTSLLETNQTTNTHVIKSLEAKYRRFVQELNEPLSRSLGYPESIQFAIEFREFGREDLALRINPCVSLCFPKDWSRYHVPETLYKLESADWSQRTTTEYFFDMANADNRKAELLQLVSGGHKVGDILPISRNEFLSSILQHN